MLLSIWGAGLATILGVIELVKYFRDKACIKVRANLSFRATNHSTDIKGTLVETEHGPNEVLLSITAANHGRQALQITACLIEGVNGNLHQVIPVGLPALLEPNTQVQVEIQKEWLDLAEVARIGVIDALGRIHEVGRSEVVRILTESKSLPSNKQKYKHRMTGKMAVAFQVKDKAVLIQRDSAAG